ncbi:MAG: hypothetical protein MdMp014T_1085 [Treponematales bacterium]
MTQEARGLLAGLPRALRARDFFLYLEDGRRLTDLWLCGGRAALGHKNGRVVRDLKNAAERGLFAPLPHPFERRFLRALALLLPGRRFRVYGPGAEAGHVLAAAGLDGAEIRDPALGEAAGAGAALWRPFLDEAAPDWDAIPALVPALPEPAGLCVLALTPECEAARPFPPSDIVPPAFLAPAAGAASALLAAMKTPRRPPGRVEKALRRPGCLWKRRGVYLSLKAPPDGAGGWAAVFAAFLQAGFLIPPSPTEPLILPAALSGGLQAKLAALLGTGALGGQGEGDRRTGAL